ncbi:MAG: ABC transporter ATP-binding protein [Anaerolineales bacterium]|nr:ABC transporter ATP-binding protein [Anaerolineales bacterium]
MSNVIEIKDYSWKYLNTSTPALENINLTIEEGSFVGVIGPNGSGKTTLAYSIDGLIPGQYNGIKKGTVNVFGKEVEDYGRGELQHLVGVVFSDPEAQFTAMTVEDELVFGMENIGLSIPEIQERLDWVTELTDLGPLLEKPPYEISGGQKQRVALAAVLAMRPKVLILDEPTSMLDPMSRQRIFDVLVRLKAEENSTIIVIEHSLEHLVRLAERMILMSDGSLVLDDSTRNFFRQTDFLLEKNVSPPGVIGFFHELSRIADYQKDPPLDVEEAHARLQEILQRGNEG